MLLDFINLLISQYKSLLASYNFSNEWAPQTYISTFSLVLAALSIYLNVRWKSKERKKDAQAEYDDLIEDISKLNAEQDALNRSLGNEARSTENTRSRSILNERRDVLISRVDKALRKGGFTPSDISLIIVAGSLLEAGKTSEAAIKYKMALDKPSSKFEAALHQRSYGRALILSENIEKGRLEMLEAISKLEKLGAGEDYDAHTMWVQSVEARKRMIDAILTVGCVKCERAHWEEILKGDYRDFVRAFQKCSKQKDRIDFHFTAVDFKYRIMDTIKEQVPVPPPDPTHGNRVTEDELSI